MCKHAVFDTGIKMRFVSLVLIELVFLIVGLFIVFFSFTDVKAARTRWKHLHSELTRALMSAQKS